MPNKLYISTSAFRANRLENILESCLRNNFVNLELGSNLEYSQEGLDSILSKKNKSMNFILHNYFPRPEKDFVLNLASDNEGILKKSIGHCRESIDFSAKIRAPFYSVHAGFAFHATPEDLGSEQTQLPRIAYHKAYKIYLNSINELVSYAKESGVRLAVENNVLSGFNLRNGKNEILLLVEAEEMLKFYNDVSSDNLCYLVDLGHLKVSSSSLKFNEKDFLNKILPLTIALHLSDNNGQIDSHFLFGEDVWFKDILRANKDKFFIIEARSLREDEIRHCYDSVLKILNQ